MMVDPSVMAGLVPAIHVMAVGTQGKKDVDARHKVSRPGRPKGRTRVPGMTSQNLMPLV
jgi:hypothetical protein